MLVNIAQHFIEQGRTWLVGESVDVPTEVAQRWIADGKATADADGRRDQSSVSGDGVPAAFASRALTSADDGYTLVCASAQTATVNTGLPSGFGCAFKGTVSFAGTATVTDVRTAGGANPWCALVQIGADTYDAVGSKA